MYYGQEYLDEMIERMRKHSITENFFYNDLTVLIAFKQLRNPINSIEDVKDMIVEGEGDFGERLKKVISGKTLHDFNRAPSIPEVSLYLLEKEILTPPNKEAIQKINDAIGDLENDYHDDDIGILDNTEFADPWMVPRIEATFGIHDGKYIIQAVVKFQEYKTPSVDDQLFFDFSIEDL